ncbi:TonB-dependent receptor [Antarcticibacterium arcticum]|uniref:TonB-dependent receptor n=1 Tax=Antarcticibacterium arcticum TaxID=2585771 RepID=A0A5B8YL23_9FLAO|nr:TonB-dependent receptor [Antarcticibacterium arcticum]QED38404.1 TonB-dependent receptor [Antarcticibacterium arcticum]
MKQFLFVFLFFFIIPPSSFSQDYYLEGEIKNSAAAPLEGAHIHVDNSFTLTNAGGYFRIGNLPRGSYRMTVTYLGYQSIDTLITIGEDKKIFFTLKDDTSTLREVLVKSNARRTTSANKEVVSQVYIQDRFSGSLAKTLERLPGINSVEIGAGTSKPIIRGLGFNRIAVSENGIKQEGQQWGADHGLEIDAFSVENLEIIKGVGAIEHGSDAIGGVIKIINDRIPREGLTGEVIVLGKTVNNTVAASTNLAYKKENFFYKIKATGSEFGDYSVPTNNIVYLSQNIPIFNERLKNTAGKEVDLYGQVGYLANNYKGTLSLSNVYFKGGFFPGAHGVPSIRRVQDDGDKRNIDYPFQRVNHFKAISKNEWFFTGSTLDVTLGYQNNHRQEWSRFHTHYQGQTPPEKDPDLELNFNLNTFDAQVKYSRALSETHSASIGVQSQVQDNKLSGYNFLLPEYFRTTTGIYLTHEYRASQKVTLNLGGRFDYSKISIEENYDPRLFEYLINKGQEPSVASGYATRSSEIERDFTNWNLMAGLLNNIYPNWDASLNAGTSFRLPTAIELGANGIHHGSFRHEQGDPNLDPEKGYVVDAKLNYSKDGFKASMSPYIYYFDNYIYLNPSGIFSVLPHSGQIYQFTQNAAVLTGVEVEVEKTFFGKLRTQAVFEYLYNRQVTAKRSGNYPLPFSPPVNGFGEVGYLLFENSKSINSTEIFANTSFALEQNRIAQTEETTPGYQIFGAGFRTSLSFGNFKADVNLQLTNIFNTKYFNHTNFYRALEIPEMGRNIQLMLRIPINK